MTLKACAEHHPPEYTTDVLLTLGKLLSKLVDGHELDGVPEIYAVLVEISQKGPLACLLLRNESFSKITLGSLDTKNKHIFGMIMRVFRSFFELETDEDFIAEFITTNNVIHSMGKQFFNFMPHFPEIVSQGLEAMLPLVQKSEEMFMKAWDPEIKPVVSLALMTFLSDELFWPIQFVCTSLQNHPTKLIEKFEHKDLATTLAVILSKPHTPPRSILVLLDFFSAWLDHIRTKNEEDYNQLVQMFNDKSLWLTIRMLAGQEDSDIGNTASEFLLSHIAQ